MSRLRKALFLGFCKSPYADEPPMIIFYVEHLLAFVELRERHVNLKLELVVVLSPFPELTSGDFFDTFPSARERSAGRISHAEFTYTDSTTSAQGSDGRKTCSEDAHAGAAAATGARPGGQVVSGKVP